jgi:hypothetical protein
VIAYNIQKTPGALSAQLRLQRLITHGAHPFYNLYEGNHLHKWARIESMAAQAIYGIP